ncbi:MAG: CPBP family intramembrane glutamic endopeptidase [Planctomycetota bacterium]
MSSTAKPLDRLVLAFALGFPSLLTWTYFVALAGHGTARIAYAAGKLLQFALPVGWLLVGGWRASRPRLHLHGAGAGLCFGALVAAALLVAHHGVLKHHRLLAPAPALIHGRLHDFGLDSAAGMLALAVFYSAAHSLLEEYYWRWFVFGELARRLPLAAAIALSSVGFMAHHVILIGQLLHDFGSVTWCLSAGVAMGGAFWAWLYRRSGSLLAPWLSHALVDAALMYAGYDLAFGSLR